MLLFACCIHKEIDLIEKKNLAQCDTHIFNTYTFGENKNRAKF